MIKKYLKDDELPLLSIVCITFNHEKFISKTLDGFLAQKTSFKFEILVHDDASTDDTQNILKKYQKIHPDLFSLNIQKQNQYSKTGFEFIFHEINRARGKYIAMCEGDDYWTNPEKLEIQVGFLEKNPNFSMTFHDAEILSNFQNYPLQWHTPPKEILDIRHIIWKHYIPTCSLVFRKSSLPVDFPIFVRKCISADVPIEIILAESGPAKYFPAKMSVYRKHISGITMNIQRQKRVRYGYIEMYSLLNKYFKYKYNLIFMGLILKHLLGILKDKIMYRL